MINVHRFIPEGFIYLTIVICYADIYRIIKIQDLTEEKPYGTSTDVANLHQK